MTAALDAEDQVVAAQRDLDEHLLRRHLAQQRRADRPRTSRRRRGRCATRGPMRTDSRMWKRSVSGGTSPSVSSPACSVIFTRRILRRAGSRASTSAARSRGPPTGSSSGCTRLRLTTRGSAAAISKPASICANTDSRALARADLGDVADRDAAAGVGLRRAALQQLALARLRLIEPVAGGARRPRRGSRRRAACRAASAKSGSQPAAIPRAAPAPPSGVTISSR